MERSNCKSFDKAKDTLTRLLNRSKYVEMKPQFRVDALLKHKCQEATYRKADGWILVIEKNILKTIHTGQARRWKKPEESNEQAMCLL
jgi:hypothetical protein